MLIEKTQFKDYVDFSDNISDKKLAGSIRDAHVFDFEPLVPAAFYSALKELIESNIPQWSRTSSYVIGDKAYSTINQKKYVAIAINADLEPSANSAKWTEIRLATLFDDYVKPYLIYSAFSRYLLWAGRHVAQGGIRVMNDDTSVEISDKSRGELIADIDNKKSFSLSRLMKTLSDNSYTYDGVLYAFETDCEVSRPKRNFKIRAV